MVSFLQAVDALIVGGGPAGLAVALLLHKRGWKRIVVLEQQPSVTKVGGCVRDALPEGDDPQYMGRQVRPLP